MTRAAHALVERLAELGARFAFGIPGGPIIHVFHQLAISERIRFVLSRHEAGAGFAAMGRAFVRAPNEVPLCIATAGPGATNLLTGVAAADHERVPIFAITGDVAMHLRGRGAVQDSSANALDVARMFAAVTARSVIVEREDELVPVAEELYALAIATRRPVHLHVPVDVSGRVTVVRGRANAGARAGAGTVADAQLRDVLASFLAAERPVVFAGNGVKLSRLQNPLREIAERHGLPVIVSAHGKGAFDEGHPLYAGAFGIAARPEGRRFLEAERPDACLFLGTSLNESSTGAWSPLLASVPTKIHIDLDATRLARGFPIEHAIAADIADALAVLAALPARAPRSRALAPPLPLTPLATDPARPVHPRALFQALARSLPERCRIVSDIGNCMLWAIQELSLAPEQELFVPLGLGSMGSGIGAAVGVAVSEPEVATVCLAGDAATLMLGAELHTAIANDASSLAVIVLNDGGHGTVDAGLGMLELRGASVRFPTRVDFAGWGRALGFESYVLRDNAELARFDWQAFHAGARPRLLDVHVDATVPPPLDVRIKGLVPGLITD